MPRGGARPGAGAKKGAPQHATKDKREAAEILRELLRPHQAEVAAALISKAKEGDISAIKEYHERLAGKVKDVVEVEMPLLLDI